MDWRKKDTKADVTIEGKTRRRLEMMTGGMARKRIEDTEKRGMVDERMLR